MRTVAGRYQLAHWDSMEEDDEPVAPALAMEWLRPWLIDPEHRGEVLEVCSWLGPGLSPARGWMDERDLHAYVRPRIERALLSGELVLLERNPISGWKPSIIHVEPEPAPPAPAPVVPEAPPAKIPEPAAPEPAFDAVTQAATLKLAAASGTPFCEECERLAKAS